MSPDTLIPEPGSPLAWDRYSHSRNNPINYNDPSGHWPEWFDAIGQFLTGLSVEFTRTSNWTGAIVSPSVAESLAPSTGETDAMLAGRIAGDILTVVVGVVEVAGGIAISGGGTIVGCATTLCLASAPAIAAGVAVTGYGAATSLEGAAALGENLGRAYSRHKNDLEPDPKATGPHSTFKRDPETGKVTNYETYEPNPRNPSGWDTILRYDGVGKPHFDPKSGDDLMPHLHDFRNHDVRPPYDYEIPK